VTTRTPADRFTAMMREHGRAVLGYLSRRTEPAQDAADLMAEVFVVAWRRLAEVPEPAGEARAWLLGTARLVLANHRRGTARRHRLANRLRLALRPATGFDGGGGAVSAALSRLGENDRELLTLIAWEDLTPAQAAVVIGIPAATARKRLERARARLREILEADGSPLSGHLPRPARTSAGG
jgi:DNA-directed RNA polymerase specialized sigma24 family protein